MSDPSIFKASARPREPLCPKSTVFFKEVELWGRAEDSRNDMLVDFTETRRSHASEKNGKDKERHLEFQSQRQTQRSLVPVVDWLLYVSRLGPNQKCSGGVQWRRRTSAAFSIALQCTVEPAHAKTHSCHLVTREPSRHRHLLYPNYIPTISQLYPNHISQLYPNPFSTVNPAARHQRRQ